jgi:hypothetical protein
MANTRTKWRSRFVEALGQSGNVALACRAAGVARSSVYELRNRDPEFAAAWSGALEEACDALEAEARRRAMEGMPQKKFTRSGEPILDPETGEQYVERVYSDQLLVFLLKGHRPERYRERIEHTGRNGGPIRTQQVPLDLTQLSDEELDDLERLVHKAASDAGGDPK